jgi:hypothetical protein
LNIPPCRLAATSTPLRADISFANAAWKPLHVVFLLDISRSTAGALPVLKSAIAGPGGAIDQLFDNYPGEVRVGLVAFSLPYDESTLTETGAGASASPFAVNVNTGSPHYCSGTNETQCASDSDCTGPRQGGTCLIDPLPLDSLAPESARVTLKDKVNALTARGDDDAYLGYDLARVILTTYPTPAEAVSAEKVIIYVSDGSSTSYGTPGEGRIAANAAKVAGIKIYTIGFPSQAAYLCAESSDCPAGSSGSVSGVSSCTYSAASGCSHSSEYHYFGSGDLDPIYGQIIDAILNSGVVRIGGTGGVTTLNVSEGANRTLNTNVSCNPNASQQIPFWISFEGTGTVGFSNTRLRYCP